MTLKNVEEVSVIIKKSLKERKGSINENNLMSYIDALAFKQEHFNHMMIPSAVPYSEMLMRLLSNEHTLWLFIQKDLKFG